MEETTKNINTLDDLNTSAPIKKINYRDEWALALMQKGVIVSIEVYRWYGSTSLSAEELGLTYNDEATVEFMKKYIKLGSEKLIPPEIEKELKVIETRARNCLNAYTFNTIWGKFMPYSVWGKWNEENEIIRKEFLSAMTAFCEKYDEIVVVVRENYKKLAKCTWKKIYPHDNQEPSAAFIEDFINKITAKIPPKEKIMSSVKYEVSYFSIPLPSFLQEDLLKTEYINNERELEEYRKIVNKELMNEEKESKKKIIAEYENRKRYYIDSFLDSTVLALRANISELCDKIREAILTAKKEEITPTNLNKIRTLIENVKLFNFYNDKEINEMIKDLNTEISKFKGERDKSVILKKLQNITDLASKQVMDENFNPTISFIEF